MIKLSLPIATAAILAIAPIAHAQWDDSQKQASNIGLEVGVYFPSDSTMRDLFGNSVLKVGLGSVAKASNKKSRTFTDFSIISGNKDGNKFTLVPFTFGYEIRPNASLQAISGPYFRVQAGYAYYDYALTLAGDRIAAKRGGPTAAVEAGVNVSEKWQVAVRYNWFQKYDGLNFNGLQLSATYALARF